MNKKRQGNKTTNPKEGKEVWVMMMRDSIRVLLALKPKELMESGYSVDMIPTMIEVLEFHKLTNAGTLELLKKKQAEIHALSEADKEVVVEVVEEVAAAGTEEEEEMVDETEEEELQRSMDEVEVVD